MSGPIGNVARALFRGNVGSKASQLSVPSIGDAICKPVDHVLTGFDLRRIEQLVSLNERV